ncbi:hypothetical protein ACFVRD_34110 [Streptomyces sp. NPDC057908]|uniref:hypothetical protein n=1 Tax=Streptomyces sp. NPDC057908 TaxID=3346276 RepID=UPI0036E090B2
MIDRIPLSDLTADTLDQLYARLNAAEQEAEATAAAAAHLTTLVGKRAEKAERSAEKQRRRAKSAETELHVLRSGLRANGADPTQIQNLWAQIRLRNGQWREAKQRAEQAEAAIERVRNLAAVWDDAPDPLAKAMARDLRTTITGRATVDQPQQPTTTAQHTGGNAEDCGACSGTNPPYPWICPAEQQQPTA